MKNSQACRNLFLLLLFSIILFLPGARQALAADASEASESEQTAVMSRKAGWHRKKLGYIYCDETGKRISASSGSKYVMYTIDGKVYAFNSKGYQVHYWRKINGKYYYFGRGNGKDGYMRTDKKVMGITLKKSGAASLSGSRHKRKVVILAEYTEWMDQILKKIPLASRSKKLKACFDYLRRLPYKNVGHLRKNDSNRDLWYAEYIYQRKTFDCHVIAAGFAYMAMILGYNKIDILSFNWHSFVRINEKYYDPSLARHNLKSYKLYAQTKPFYNGRYAYRLNVRK